MVARFSGHFASDRVQSNARHSSIDFYLEQRIVLSRQGARTSIALLWQRPLRVGMDQWHKVVPGIQTSEAAMCACEVWNEAVDWSGAHPMPALPEPQLVKKSALCRRVKNLFHPACSLRDSKLHNWNFWSSLVVLSTSWSIFMPLKAAIYLITEVGGSWRLQISRRRCGAIRL